MLDVKDSKIALIIINSKTVERFNGYPKFSDHKKFLEMLLPYEPKFVVYDMTISDNKFSEINGSEADQMAFAFQAGQFENFYVGTQDLEMKGEEGKLKLESPLDSLNLASNPKTTDNSLFGKDGVSRRLMLSYQDNKMLQPKIASFYNPEIQNFSKIRGQFDVFDSVQTYINFHPSNNFRRYRFEDVVGGIVPKNAFRGKIVLVGTDTGLSSKDYTATPFTRVPEEFPNQNRSSSKYLSNSHR